MKTCENCSSLTDGNYGSGRFCSSVCARAYSTKARRKEINEKVSLKLSGVNNHTGKLVTIERTCKCGMVFKTTEKKNKIYCSSECALESLHTNRAPHKSSTKNKISKSVKRLYEQGKLVYGGITKWTDVNTSIGVIKVQGTFEARTCKILDRWKVLGTIDNWEYTNDRIKYVGHDGKYHNYLLDFKVFKKDGSYYYIETKGYVRPNDQLKWNAAKQQGLILEVWLEQDIKNKE